jgi:phosphinothricin acetyltransferase
MTSRPALISDATSIAAIYSAGILERVATFETEPRAAEDVAVWFESPLPKIVVEEDGRVVAFAAAFPYSDRCCYTR